MAVHNSNDANNAKGSNNNTLVGGSVAAFQAMFQAPASHNQAGDLLNQFSTAFKEAIQKMPSSAISQYRILPIDTGSVNGTVQMLALYSRQNDEISFYTFILEGTLVSDLQPRIFNAGQNQQEIAIPTFTGDLYTEEMSRFVAGRIQAAEDGADLGIYDAGCLTIHNTLDAEEQANIHVMIWRAANAVQSVFDDADESKPRLNLYHFKDLNFSGKIDFNPGQGVTSSNMPVRRDVALSVTATDKNNNNEPNSLMRSAIQLARIGAYVDLRYVGPSQAPAQPGYPAQIDPARVYAPTLSIVDTNTLTNQISLELQLFALGEFVQLTQGSSWMNMLRTQFGGNSESAKLRNIAGLKHELGELIQDPESPDFNLMRTLNQVTYPNLIHVLHTDATSDLSWIHNYLRLAAGGDRDAIETIRVAANNLTNNEFDNFFPHGETIATIENDRVLLGYYNAGNELRDLRDLDTLAMLNMFGETDMALVEDFTNTLLPQTGSLEQRISDRIAILRRVFEGNVVFTGMAVPVILNGKFLQALNAASRKAGANVIYHDSFAMQQSHDRSYLSLLNYAIDSNSVNMQNNTLFGGNANNVGSMWHGARHGY